MPCRYLMSGMDAGTALHESVGFEPQVTVEGPEPITVTSDLLTDLDVTTKSMVIVCATGNRYSADWTGPTVGSLLEATAVRPDTTHVVIESADGYRVAIQVREALGGVLAFLKNGEQIGRQQEYMNRLVCPGTDGARDIKGVSRIEPVTLEPDDDPEKLENLFPDGERFTADRELDDDDTHEE